MSTIVYETCCQTWRGDEFGAGVTTVKLLTGFVLARFPLGFLLAGGASARKVSYLHVVVRLMTDYPEDAKVVLIHEDFPDDNDESEVRAGSYVLQHSEPLRLALGPQGKSKYRAYEDEDDPSTMSGSSRSSIKQSRFELRVLFRDGQCLATHDHDPDSVMAVHIVPMSLGQDYLDNVTRIPGTIGLFSVKNGLTLRRDLHSKFDNYQWSIFVAGNLHFIHVFGDSNHDIHGTIIDYGQSKPSEWPNRELLMWHYQQCLLARIRGYHVSQ